MNHEFEKYIVNPKEIDSYLYNANLEFLSFEKLTSENRIYDAVEGKKHEIKKRLIENWDLFEKNELDFTEQDFFDFFLSNISKDELIILITQEGTILKKCGFKFPVSDFFKFSSLYENYFSMEFFQLSYYCLVASGPKICKFLDDEGCIHEFLLARPNIQYSEN